MEPVRRGWEEDEISIAEIVARLVARKWLIGAVTLLFVLAAAAYLATSPKIYVSVAEIAIGEIHQGDQAVLLEQENELGNRLIAEFGHDKYRKREYPMLASVSLDKKRSSILHLEAEAEDPAEAKAFLQEIIDGVMEEHAKRRQSFRAIQEDALKDVSGQARYLRGQLTGFEQEMLADKNLKRDATEAAVIQLMRGTLVDRLASLEAREKQIELEMTDTYSRPTRLLSAPKLPERPAKPKSLLILTLAAILGLLGGALSALLAETVSRRRTTPVEETAG